MSTVPDHVGVYGGGRMGGGIAHAFAVAGAAVTVVENDDASAASARERIAASLSKAAEKGVAVPGAITVVTDATALVACPLVVEAAARREAAELAVCEMIIRQATWPSGAAAWTTANKKGNSAKTPATIAVGGKIASVRGGGVALVEASDDPGQLAGRSEGEQRRGIGELIQAAPTIGTKAQLEGFAVPQTSFAHTFGSSAARRAPLDRGSVRQMAELVDQYYSLRAMDSGNVYTSSAFTGAMETSDALLVPMMNATDSMGEAVELFDYLRQHPEPHFQDLAEKAIVVRVSDGRPEVKVERLVKDFQHRTGISEDRMFVLPFDAHLAERGPITLAKLSPATHAALLRISAALILQLQDATDSRT